MTLEPPGRHMSPPKLYKTIARCRYACKARLAKQVADVPSPQRLKTIQLIYATSEMGLNYNIWTMHHVLEDLTLHRRQVIPYAMVEKLRQSYSHGTERTENPWQYPTTGLWKLVVFSSHRDLTSTILWARWESPCQLKSHETLTTFRSTAAPASGAPQNVRVYLPTKCNLYLTSARGLQCSGTTYEAQG